MKLNECETFWVFVSMMENYLPIEFYSDMFGVAVDMKVFEYLLKERYPKIVDHLMRYNYHLDLISFEWLLTMFLSHTIALT